MSRSTYTIGRVTRINLDGQAHKPHYIISVKGGGSWRLKEVAGAKNLHAFCDNSIVLIRGEFDGVSITVQKITRLSEPDGTMVFIEESDRRVSALAELHKGIYLYDAQLAASDGPPAVSTQKETADQYDQTALERMTKLQTWRLLGLIALVVIISAIISYFRG